MIQASYDQVFAAVGELAADPDAEWPLESYGAGQRMAQRMGRWEDWLNQRTNLDRQAVNRFHGQCLRALNALAAEGVLRKAGKGTLAPTGHFLTNEAQFYTPDAWTRAEEARDRRKADEAALRARWEAVYDNLVRAGYEPRPVPNVTGSQARGLEVTVTIESWERLLRALPSARYLATGRGEVPS